MSSFLKMGRSIATEFSRVNEIKIQKSGFVFKIVK